LAIIPLAKILGTATEELASRVGSGVGGLLNATFGNATELIIAIVALNAGLTEVVKASIVGSIIGNILFVLGLAMFLGGLGRERQKFNRTGASANASQFTLAAVGLAVPQFYILATHNQNELTAEEISVGIAIVLLLAYVAQMIFFLRTHSFLYNEAEEVAMHGARWTAKHSLIVLGVATLMIAGLSELLVEGVEYLTVTLGWSEAFVGVILIAIIGNAAEHMTAVTVAMRDRMELAMAIATGSSLQIALFVAPALVFIGLLLGKPMNLVFTLFELVAVGVALMLTNLVQQDGESNWLEGVQLLAAYLILAIAFFFVP
ncbi:MAG TPA: calcium/proton exchanger, partial [Chloroflexia bacterium]|nr:calcium/proton exchanger [Chloroflexia bacterium]